MKKITKEILSLIETARISGKEIDCIRAPVDDLVKEIGSPIVLALASMQFMGYPIKYSNTIFLEFTK